MARVRDPTATNNASQRTLCSKFEMHAIFGMLISTGYGQ